MHATADDVPTEAAIAEVQAALEAAVGQLEGKCREVIKALVSLWQEMGVPLAEQEAKEEEFNALDHHHRLRAVNAEHVRYSLVAAWCPPNRTRDVYMAHFLRDVYCGAHTRCAGAVVAVVGGR